jgi:hypothetical protein
MKLKLNIKNILIFTGVFLSLFSIVYIILSTRKNITTKEAPTATPVSVFKLTGTSPLEGNTKIAIPNLAIEFTFSKNIDPSSLSITIDPKEDISFNFGENKNNIFVHPEKNWKYGTKYTISMSVQSESGEGLNSPITYIFTPQKETGSSLNESGFK